MDGGAGAGSLRWWPERVAETGVALCGWAEPELVGGGSQMERGRQERYACGQSGWRHKWEGGFAGVARAALRWWVENVLSLNALL